MALAPGSTIQYSFTRPRRDATGGRRKAVRSARRRRQIPWWGAGTRRRHAQERTETMPRYRCILFDLDGTLIDTKTLILRSFRYALSRVLGRDYPDEVLLAGQGTPIEEQMRRFDAQRADELVRTYTEFYLREHDALIAPFPGIPELLADLQAQGIRMAAVTSKRRRAAEMALARCHLAPYLAHTICPGDTREAKPSPEPVREALRRLQCRPQEAAMVGDSPYDMESARAAGVDAIGVTWGSHPAARLWEAGATVVVASVPELRAYISPALPGARPDTPEEVESAPRTGPGSGSLINTAPRLAPRGRAGRTHRGATDSPCGRFVAPGGWP